MQVITHNHQLLKARMCGVISPVSDMSLCYGASSTTGSNWPYLNSILIAWCFI